MADGEVIAKVCTKCQISKPITGFTTSKQTSDGLYPWCLECNKERAKIWAANNRERVRSNRRRHYLANKEKALEQADAWRAANPDKVKSAARVRDKKRSPEQVAKQKARRHANPDKYREKQVEYYAENADKVKALVHAYRARKRGAEGRYTVEDIERIAKMQNNRCAYCRIDVSNARVVDHIKSLSKGGTNYPKNLQIVCLPCNSSKRDKDPIEFSQQLGLLV